MTRDQASSKEAEPVPPRAVTLDEVLCARETRAARQRDLLMQFPNAALLCLTVNAPGPIKRTPDAQRVFFAGLYALTDALAQAGMPLLLTEQLCADTGFEAYLVVDAKAAAVKRLACALEESLPYGRLLDADVHTRTSQLSRTQIGSSPRGCMVCGKVGAYCASRRAHPLAEVLSAFCTLAALAPETRP